MLIIAVPEDQFDSCIESILQNHIIDIGISYLKGAEKALSIFYKYEINTAYWSFSTDAELPEIRVATHILANSVFTRHILEKHYRRPAVLLPSIVNLDEYRVSDRQPHYITYINPRKEKGLFLFSDFVRLLPQTPFLVVLGWLSSKYTQEEKRALKFLSRLPNVTIADATHEILTIYQKTKILLVPSLWNEAFARVVLEAQVNGIPVIASDKGNLPKTVGTGGIIISGDRPDFWAKVIRKCFDNERLLEELGRSAKKNCQKYFDKGIVSFVVESINRMAQGFSPTNHIGEPTDKQFLTAKDNNRSVELILESFELCREHPHL